MKKIFFIVAALSLMGWAQAQDTINGVFNGNVVVTGSYKPVLEDMSKLNIAPVITDTSSTLQHSFQYAISPKRMTSLFAPSRIKAARVVGEPTTRLYNNYVRLGFGNNWAPLLDAYFNSTRSQTLNYGAYINHESSWGKIGKYVDSIPYNPNYYGPNHWAFTNVGLFAKYIVKEKIQLSTDINYNNDYNHYYGFNDSVAHSVGLPVNDSIPAKDYRILYNYMAWNLGVRNLQTDVNKLGYMANAQVANLWASYNQNEFNLNLSGDVHYGFPLLSQYKGVAYLHADWQAYKTRWITDTLVPLGASAPLVGGDSLRAVRNLVKLNPYVDFIFNNFNFHAGLTLGVDAYSSDTTKARFKIYPDIVVSKSFMNESLNLSLGAVGNALANSLNSIRLINPYLLPSPQQLEATSHYDFFATMRMNFNKKLRFDAHAQYSLLQSDLTFVETGLLHNMYEPVFVDLNKVEVGGEFSFINDELLQLSLGGNYYLYNNKNAKTDLTFRLYRPDFDAHLNIALNYHNKWLFKAQALLLGQMYAHYIINSESLAEFDTSSLLPMRTGVNMEVEYRHNKALSFFARFDNITAQRYFYWLNYPSHRFQFLLGLTYTIH